MASISNLDPRYIDFFAPGMAISAMGPNNVIKNIVGTFTAGEAIAGASSGQSATTVSITKREYDNKYIEVSDLVYGVTKILAIGQASSSKNIFDLQ